MYKITLVNFDMFPHDSRTSYYRLSKPFRQFLDQLSSLGIPNGRPSRQEFGHGAKCYWGVCVLLHPINLIIGK